MQRRLVARILGRPKIIPRPGRENTAWGVHDPATWLFVAQGYHGVYLARPPGWDDRGGECHNS